MVMASSCRGYSKAQMCFFKILRIISSTPPSKELEQQPFPFPTKGVGIDLNLRFCSVEESAESEYSRSDNASATAQANNNEEDEEEEGFPEKSVEVSEKLDNNNINEVINNHVETASFQGRDNSNCFDLLIEAARVVSGKDESDSEELGAELTTRRGASKEKRREKWVVVDLYGDVLEEREPVVRSKRGRNQALPYRFRDSIVEPLKRATRSQRPSTAHLSKRLLRSSTTT